LAFEFLPRKYEKGDRILSQGDEVHEIYLITSGELKVGFKYMKSYINRYYNKGYYFGDYNVFSDNNSEYIYEANSTLKILALPKYKFLSLVDKYENIKGAMISSGF
jgi:CRP-like cAMP-binding protein